MAQTPEECSRVFLCRLWRTVPPPRQMGTVPPADGRGVNEAVYVTGA